MPRRKHLNPLDVLLCAAEDLGSALWKVAQWHDPWEFPSEPFIREMELPKLALAKTFLKGTLRRKPSDTIEVRMERFPQDLIICRAEP
jgi:hypothetical protein